MGEGERGGGIVPSDLTLLAERNAGATNRQIAEKWGLNPDSVRRRVKRARDRTVNLTAQVQEFHAPATLSKIGRAHV